MMPPRTNALGNEPGGPHLAGCYPWHLSPTEQTFIAIDLSASPFDANSD